MALRARRPHDPLREHLVEVRRGLLRLHKALIDSERPLYEQRMGPISNMQLLQALLEDPFFAWLRPFSGLISRMDAAMSGDEPVTPEGARGFVDEAGALIADRLDGGADENAARLARVRQRDPAVLFAQTELHRRIAAALLWMDPPP